MVFLTAMLVIIIIYYLQADGLIYATIVALIAELLNIFMAHALTKSVEKKMRARIRKLVDGYSNRIKANRKTIQNLEKIQEESVKKLYNANVKIKEYEARLDVLEKTSPGATEAPQYPSPEKSPSEISARTAPPMEEPPEKNAGKNQVYSDLPSGSNRKKLPL
ncbi:MAG: hypothetical protein V2J08_16000 [Desulfotignum sp.]|jgi:predicted RecB family endonuclease|nr:hypothetical protein [Desulfotignum sp.]